VTATLPPIIVKTFSGNLATDRVKARLLATQIGFTGWRSKQSNNLRVQAARKRRVRAPNAFIGFRCSKRCWGELEPDLLQRLSASMTKRIQMVLDAEGKAIDR